MPRALLLASLSFGAKDARRYVSFRMLAAADARLASPHHAARPTPLGHKIPHSLQSQTFLAEGDAFIASPYADSTPDDLPVAWS